MNGKNPGEWASTDEFGLTEGKERSNAIRAKLLPLVRALARAAARDWLDKVANDNSTKLTQNSPDPEQE